MKIGRATEIKINKKIPDFFSVIIFLYFFNVSFLQQLCSLERNSSKENKKKTEIVQKKKKKIRDLNNIFPNEMSSVHLQENFFYLIILELQCFFFTFLLF